jgi:hypothetical protein
MPRDTPISKPVPTPPEVAFSAPIHPTMPTAEAHSSQVHEPLSLANARCDAAGASISFLFFICRLLLAPLPLCPLFMCHLIASPHRVAPRAWRIIRRHLLTLSMPLSLLLTPTRTPPMSVLPRGLKHCPQRRQRWKQQPPPRPSDAPMCYIEPEIDLAWFVCLELGNNATAVDLDEPRSLRLTTRRPPPGSCQWGFLVR